MSAIILTPPTLNYCSILGFQIYFYGIILAFAIFIAFSLANLIAKKYFNIIIEEFSLPLLIFGIIGARLYYCTLNFSTYIHNPLRILNLREGGLSIHGAIIAGLITLFFLSKKHKIQYFTLTDIYAATLPLAQAIGRWGNYFNSEAFGKPTDSLIMLYIKSEFKPFEYQQYEYFHPTFLYESILNIILFIFLYNYVLKRFHKNTGLTSGIYLTGYSIIRLLIEPLRIDCCSYINSIPTPMVISTIFCIIGIIITVCSIKKIRSSK